MSYIKRIIEDDLLGKLSASGAMLIKGPKSCGKTATAKQFANSVLEMDRDKKVPIIMDIFYLFLYTLFELYESISWRFYSNRKARNS